MAALLLVSAAVLGGGIWARTSQAANTGPQVSAWLDDLKKTLKKVKKALEDSSAAAAANDMEGLDFALDRAIANIDQILDPAQYPSLDPPEAGTTDTTVNPQTLGEYALITLDMATEADLEAESGPDFDNEFVGTQLRTIKYLIIRPLPHNYRTMAGLED